MGKCEKLLAQWSRNIPPTVPKHEVFGLARRYGLVVEEGGGSHAVVRDDRLRAFGAEGHAGDVFGNALTLPSVGGWQVKRRYVKNLVSFILYLRQIEEVGNETEAQAEP